MYIEWRHVVRDGLRQAQYARAPVYERTRRFRAYSSWLIPGMIQTPDYTEHVLRAVQRRHDIADDVELALAARLERQRLLTEGSRRFAFLIEEPVLRCGVAEADVMTEQLRHLMDAATLPNVSLGVVPTRLGRERWPVEDFWIFDNAQVNVELVSGRLTVTQPGEVAIYADTFARLADLAVYGAEARRRINAAIVDVT